MAGFGSIGSYMSRRSCMTEPNALLVSDRRGYFGRVLGTFGTDEGRINKGIIAAGSYTKEPAEEATTIAIRVSIASRTTGVRDQSIERAGRRNGVDATRSLEEG